MSRYPTPQVGQVWVSHDLRKPRERRIVTVRGVDPDHVILDDGVQEVRVKRTRMSPEHRGYGLVLYEDGSVYRGR